MIRALVIVGVAALVAGASWAMSRSPGSPPAKHSSRGTALDASAGVPLPGATATPVSAERWVGLNDWALASASDINGFCGKNSQFILDEKLELLKRSGVDVVRFAAYQSFAIDASHARNWASFDRVFAAAEAHGIRLIPILGNNWLDCDYWGSRPEEYACSDLDARSCGTVKACGGEGNWYDVGYTQPYDGYLSSFLEWVSEIVTRYRGSPALEAWEVLNEPTGRCLHDFFVDITSRIRAADPVTPISLGGDAAGWNFSEENALPDVGLVTGHDYHRPTEALPVAIANGMLIARTLGKPYYVGEAGIDACDTTERANQLKAKMRAAFDAGAVGYLVWAYRHTAPPGFCGMDFGPQSPILSIFAEN